MTNPLDALCQSTIRSLSLSQACVRFRYINQDSNLNRHLNLSRCYSLTVPILKCILAGPKCKHILVLNLNYCYWIPRADLLTLAKLSNLKELHVLDCHLTTKALLATTRSMALTALSWTWPPSDKVSGDPQTMKNLFARLEKLTIQLRDRWNNNGNFVVTEWILSFCADLRELNVLCSPIGSGSYSLRNSDFFYGRGNSFALPKLRSVIWDYDAEFVANDVSLGKNLSILQHCAKGNEWRNFWFTKCGVEIIAQLIENGQMTLADLSRAKSLNLSGGGFWRRTGNCSDALSYWIAGGALEFACEKLELDCAMPPDHMESILERFTNVKDIALKNLKINSNEDRILDLMSNKWIYVTRLDLKSCYFPTTHINVCAALANLKELRYLSISGCLVAIKSTSSSQSVDAPVGAPVTKKIRYGLVTHSPDALPIQENGGICLLTQGCPHVRSLEISGFCCGIPREKVCQNSCAVLKDDDLNAISLWRHLESLTLTDLPTLTSCTFLIAISNSCPLGSLKLRDIGQRAICCYEKNLVVGLGNCRKLVDFSICQDSINVEKLCTALTSCKRLVRVCFQHQTTDTSWSNYKRQTFVSMFEKLKKLLVFYLLTTSMTKKWASEMQHLLIEKFLPSRPPLNVVITKGLDEKTVMSCPVCHISELIL